MSIRKAVGMILLFATGLGGAFAHAGTFQYELRPISATGPHSIDGGEITVRPEAEVTVELYVSGWAPVELEAVAARLECAGLESASVGTLIPIESGTEIDFTRTDYVFFGLQGFPACALIPCTCVLLPCPPVEITTAACEGNAFQSSVPDPGIPKYLATYRLQVPADAVGTFTVGLNLEPGISVAIDGSGEVIEPVNVIPAVITVDPLFGIPTVSDWGLIVLALLLLSAGTICVLRRRGQGHGTFDFAGASGV